MVLGLPPSVRIYFATALVDMRNGIDGLSAVIEQVLREDPYQGHLFVFVGKQKDKVKVLYWDQNGFVLYMKRLERGRFQMPTIDGRRNRVEMQSEELQMLLKGIDLNAKRLARWSPSIDKGIDTDR